MKRLIAFAVCLNITYVNIVSAMNQLSESPRVYHFSSFLSDEECDLIIQQASRFMQRSTVLGASEGIIDSRRTSEGMFFPSNPPQPNLRKIEKRIADIVDLPVANGEGIQILHYDIGAEYQPHYDYFLPCQPGGEQSLARGGQRVATFLVYLNSTEEGGETVFPQVELAVKPRKGDALLFYNVTPDGEPDSRSLHGGAPVIKGEKWLMTKWIRERTFR